MITHDLIQGSPEWLAYRAKHFNASDAPAMMGCSPYKPRSALLRELHTGMAADVDAGTQRVFDAGHRYEALARPQAEKIIGEELYPCVGSSGRYSASFDGLTLAEDVVFEHKSANAELRALLTSGAGEFGELLPLHYRVQMEQQMMVSGADRALFMATLWDGEVCTFSAHCWYAPDAELRAAIMRGWDQFAADLAAYALPDAVEPARAAPMESLPAVTVRLDGALSVAGNLPTFAEALKSFIARMPTRPATDDEFATVDAACKALKKAEEALDAAEAGALASITDVEAMRRAVADCRKLARDTRLAAEKLVERRKTEIKEHAVTAACRALDDHVAALQAELAPMRLLPVAADFAGCIRGLRSIDSMQNALDTTLAGAKIAADGQARGIRANIATFKARATGLEALFADLQHLVHKAADDFGAVLDARIAKHQADEAAKEAARAAAEAQRIAAAEAAAAEAARQQERDLLADQQRRQAETESAAQAQAQAAAAGHAAQAAAAVPEPAALPAVVTARQPAAGLVMIVPPPAAPLWTATMAAPAAPELATLKLGTICERLGFNVSAEFLSDRLHICAAETSGRAVLYRESQWPVIIQKLQAHISAMGELYAPSLAA